MFKRHTLLLASLTAFASAAEAARQAGVELSRPARCAVSQREIKKHYPESESVVYYLVILVYVLLLVVTHRYITMHQFGHVHSLARWSDWF
jgi:hypothetical protein